MKRFVLILTILSLITSCGNKKPEMAKEEEHHEEGTKAVLFLLLQSK